MANSSAIVGISLFTTILASLCVCLRVYVRLYVLKSFGLDDSLIIISSLLTVAGAVFNILGVSAGAGKHVYEASVNVSAVVRWNTAYQIDNVICVTFTKLSILWFVIRMQRTGTDKSRITTLSIYSVMLIMTVVNVVTVLALLLQCQPLEKLWNPEVPGICFYPEELSQFGYAQGVVNVLTDFFCTIMPVVILWNIRVSTRLKIAIAGLMSIGLFATASQVLRVVFLNSLNAQDYSYAIVGIIITAVLDQNLGIIGACVPTYQKVFLSLLQQIRTMRSKSRSSATVDTNGERYIILGGTGNRGTGNRGTDKWTDAHPLHPLHHQRPSIATTRSG